MEKTLESNCTWGGMENIRAAIGIHVSTIQETRKQLYQMTLDDTGPEKCLRCRTLLPKNQRMGVVFAEPRSPEPNVPNPENQKP